MSEHRPSKERVEPLVTALIQAVKMERDEFHERCNNSYSTDALILAKKRVALCKAAVLDAMPPSSEPPAAPASNQCAHLKPASVFAAVAATWSCPWCEIERLQRYEKMYLDAVAEYRQKGAAHEPPAAQSLGDYFAKLRRDPKHHLGLGDIRLTIAQQEELTQTCGHVDPTKGIICRACAERASVPPSNDAGEAVRMLRRLQDYIQHPYSCELQRWFKGTAEPKRCTCGLQSILNDASALVKRIEGAAETKSDPTKWDGPTHICIDNKIHIGAKERCSRCPAEKEGRHE